MTDIQIITGLQTNYGPMVRFIGTKDALLAAQAATHVMFPPPGQSRRWAKDHSYGEEPDHWAVTLRRDGLWAVTREEGWDNPEEFQRRQALDDAEDKRRRAEEADSIWFTGRIPNVGRVLEKRYPGVRVFDCEICGRKKPNGEVLFSQEIVHYLSTREILLSHGLVTEEMFEDLGARRKTKPALEYARTFSLNKRDDGYWQLTSYTAVEPQDKTCAVGIGTQETSRITKRILKQLGCTLSTGGAH